MDISSAGSVISTILRHDDKRTSYKIALLRSINDVVLNYPTLNADGRDVALPLSALAERWIAYYWPFADPERPIWQGNRYMRGGSLTNDITFRPELQALYQHWVDAHGSGQSADGFLLLDDMRVARKRRSLSASIRTSYRAARRKIARRALPMPIRHAGPGEWTVFDKPVRLKQLGGSVRALPGTSPDAKWLVVPADLWDTFRKLSLWIEALCIHEWCLFTETVDQPSSDVDRGGVYRLLTARPDSRTALTWERNHIDVLMMEGHVFTCPWSEKKLRSSSDYAVDHLIPLAVYPINELWNLVPTDPSFNSHKKRDRLPTDERLQTARPHLVGAYQHYVQQADLATALRNDVAHRFTEADLQGTSFPESVTHATMQFIAQVANARNWSRF